MLRREAARAFGRSAWRGRSCRIVLQCLAGAAQLFCSWGSAVRLGAPSATPEGAGQPPPGLHVCAVPPALVSGRFPRRGGGSARGESRPTGGRRRKRRLPRPSEVLPWPWGVGSEPPPVAEALAIPLLQRRVPWGEAMQRGGVKPWDVIFLQAAEH